MAQYAFTFTFMHLADAFIQSDLQCIQAIYLYYRYVHYTHMAALAVTEMCKMCTCGLHLVAEGPD